MIKMMMSAMTNFTGKLNSMKDSGLTSCLDTPGSAHKSGARKSPSHKKIKRIEISDDEDKTPATESSAIVSEGDCFVKPTPARVKKIKVESDLGVAPLKIYPGQNK